ncbi:MAG: transcription-repair coupling factor [Negativicutes bacterium]|nr:transcription-repair coupling factor [Negativicutes bacterium]
MQQFFDFLAADSAVKSALNAIGGPPRQTLIYGVAGTVKSVIVAGGYSRSPRPAVIITGGSESLEQWRSELANLLPTTEIIDLPAADLVTFTAAAKSVEISAKRMNALGKLANGDSTIVLATVEAVLQKVVPKEEFVSARISLTAGRSIDLADLTGSLVRLGYERVDQVDSIGQFSIRGGIIDVFPANRELPLRAELFGDEIDSLREYDPVSQRSLTVLPNVDILPFTEPEHSGATASVLSYLVETGTVIFDEPARLRDAAAKLIKENPEIKKRVYSWPELLAAAKQRNIVYLSLMIQKVPQTEPDAIISLTVKSIAPFHRQMDLLYDELKGWLDRKLRPVIFLSSRERAVAMQQNLTEEGFSAVFAETFAPPVPGTVLVTVGSLTGGFELPHAHMAVVTERDIFGRQKKKLRQKVAKDQQIRYFRDISVGDYVVHVNHGIGKYSGVETLEVGGVHKDYLLIRYAGEDKIYVPTDQVGLLQKYIGAEGEVPRLHRMGGSEWAKAKSRAKAAVADLAQDLIKLYAERQVARGFAFSPDTPWQREFEESFPYEETPDQLIVISEVKADMESPKLMDRLLCGDVGFGKTEVAIRAAFKAVMSGKQVAVLVPTTVLAQQHFQTFSGRFNGFGPVVDVISRFRSPKEQRATLAKVANGQVDVLIGTHRILNDDVEFKDLGLLIIDEEQRFGVAQKEKIKRWKTNIDVLTLTATPIPRTLHMSLVGVRDMSIIETPPEDRYPVQTYVVEYQEEIIREAIRRELRRGGQIYFVYNRVQSIEKVYLHLAEMLPDAKIGIAHGQMPEDRLEQAMMDFYEGRFDVLVCTSIIENGLDVPNANTIIVYDADYFGLSQLYQMRGRVGRSHRMAFAYFTYRRDKVLSETAEKRLQAIKEFAELGAGFKIAMRDLEIRGAGNLLGAQQSGHIVSVGFEMYCRLLEEAVQELKTGGEVVQPPPEPVLELAVDAYLPGEYIFDAMHKIEIYQRIAAIRKEEHITDLLDELIDRFGQPPAPVMTLLGVARLKNYTRELGIRSLVEKQGKVEIVFSDRPNVDVDRLMALRGQYPGRISLLPGPPETIIIKTHRLSMPLLDWLTAILSSLTAPKQLC